MFNERIIDAALFITTYLSATYFIYSKKSAKDLAIGFHQCNHTRISFEYNNRF